MLRFREIRAKLAPMAILRTSLPWAWLIALVATAGSLFFSEVMRLPPCVLCWYQRIAMYPLVLLLGVALLRGERKVLAYVWPLAGLGLAIAVYHNLLYYHVIPESLSPCVEGISCTTRQIEWFGFVTIPFLALTAFVLLNALFARHYFQQEKAV